MDDRYERDREARIRARAHRMWEEEGRPEGRSDVHWDKAAELVAIEDNHRFATEKVPSPDELSPTGEPIEPIEAVENLGEMPGALTDQGDEQPYPKRSPRSDTSLGAQASPKPAPTRAKPSAASSGKAKTPAPASRSMQNGKAVGNRARKSPAEKPQ
jgi:hypothetical protein